MGQDFIIGNRRVSETEWGSLLKVLEETGLSTQKIAEAQVFGIQELKDFFDTNQDGHLTVSDFGPIPSSTFNELDNILAKHRFLPIIQHLEDVLDALYCSTPYDACKNIPEALWNNREFLINFRDPTKHLDDILPFLKPRLEKLDIDFPKRMQDLATLATILENRDRPQNNGRPIALLIFPKTDWNEAFNNGLIRDLVNSDRFHVLYHEADGDKQLQHVIDEVSKIYRKPIHTLWIAGHGEQTSLRLGTTPEGIDWKFFIFPIQFPIMAYEAFKRLTKSYWLDNNDLEKEGGIGKSLYQAMDPHGQIILYSCSTGRGEKQGDNLANRIAELVPPGVRVISPTEPAGIKQMTVKEDGTLEIQFASGDTYITNGSR